MKQAWLRKPKSIGESANIGQITYFAYRLIKYGFHVSRSQLLTCDSRLRLTNKIIRDDL